MGIDNGDKQPNTAHTARQGHGQGPGFMVPYPPASHQLGIRGACRPPGCRSWRGCARTGAAGPWRHRTRRKTTTLHDASATRARGLGHGHGVAEADVAGNPSELNDDLNLSSTGRRAPCARTPPRTSARSRSRSDKSLPRPPSSTIPYSGQWHYRWRGPMWRSTLGHGGGSGGGDAVAGGAGWSQKVALEHRV